jgi:lipopolysaccharide export system protein LptA
MKKVKFTDNRVVQKDGSNTLDIDQGTTFENVQYEGIYQINKTFSVMSEKAHMLNKEPDVVYMTNMHVILYLDNGRIVNILSNEGRYNKVTYDCFFEDDVRATDEETKIFSDNLDLLATEDSAKIYNNVIVNYAETTLRADKIDYDFVTKYFEVSMFDDKAVKIKVLK